MVPIPRRKAPLLSMMVPRSADGLVAAELVRHCLGEALIAAGSEGAPLEWTATGIGDGLHIVLSTSGFAPGLTHAARPGLLTDLLRRVDAVTADATPVGVTLSARHERELQVHDLPLSTAPTAQGVREALRDGRRSLHVAVDHSLLDLRAHPELSRLPVLAPAQEDPAAPGETFRPTGRALSAGTAEPNSLVRLTRTTLRVEGMSGNGWHYDYHSDDDVETVDLTRLLAQWTGPRGRLWLIDHAGREVSVPLRALTRRKEFLQALAPSLRGVPTMTVRHPRRGRTSSGRLVPRLGKLAGAGLLVLIFGTVGVLAYHQDTAPAWSEQVMSWNGTAELANGTEVTAREPVPEEGTGEVTVAVTVCGGTQSYGQDPEGEPVEEQAQNTVRPSDYTLRGENGVDLAQAPSAEPAARVLERGECLPLTLRFRGERGDQPVLVHTNSAGDEITWW